MNSELLQGFYLRDVLAEPVKGQLTGRTTSAHLQPKAMEVLLHLACSPGELVTREALLENVWGAGRDLLIDSRRCSGKISSKGP